MTDEMMSLRALIEKAPDADLLREMIGIAAQRLMELEVGELTRCGLWREERRAGRPAQWLSGPRVGDPCRHRRAPLRRSIQDLADGGGRQLGGRSI